MLLDSRLFAPKSSNLPYLAVVQLDLPQHDGVIQMNANPSLLNNFYTSPSHATLVSANATTEGLVVEFSNDAGEQHYPWFWVRDHGIDAPSLDQGTNQRMVDTFSLSPELSCKSLSWIYPSK